MKSKVITLFTISCISLSLVACGDFSSNNRDKEIAELKKQINELQQQLDEKNHTISAVSESVSLYDDETQTLIDSINIESAVCYGSCGPNAMYYYKGGILVIKGSGEIVDNTWANQENKDYHLNITRVIIDEGITNIGFGVFYGGDNFFISTNLYSVQLPSTLTYIDKRAFFGCDQLKNINIPDSVVTIGNGAFYGCSLLDESTIEKINAINPGALDIIDSTE